MNNKERGKNLKKLREAKGLSQKELADKLNYTRQNLSRWENGISFPNDSEIINKLATFLDASVEDLTKQPEELKKTTQKDYKYLKISFIILLIVILIISFFIYLIKYQKIYDIYFDDYFSGVYVITYKERYINIYNIKEIKEYKNVYLYTVYNNEEKSIINTSDKNINIHENSIFDEYNLKYINKCGMHLIVYFNDNTYQKYDYYINEKEYDKTCDYDFKYTRDNYLNDYGFKYDGSNYNYIFDDNIVNYDGNNYRAYINKNDILETLESLGNSMYLYEKYNAKSEKIMEKSIRVNGSRNCNEENCLTYEDYAKFINFLIYKKE